MDEAAHELGMSVDGVRKRIERGAIPSIREGGRRYVLLDEHLTWQVKRQDSAGQERDALISVKDEQIEGLRDQVDFLRQQLEVEREANRENRRIIAGLTQRIPGIESARDDQETPEEPGYGSREEEDQQTREGAQSSSERPWWRRIFGS